MSRWTELADGKLVDLDEVKGVELIAGGYGTGFGSAAILTVPGGSVSIPLNASHSCDLPYPAYPQETPPPVPPVFSRPRTKRAYKAAWKAYREERKVIEAQYEIDKHTYDALCDANYNRAIREQFDALVCEIGARDCDPPDLS